jgi:hypothetical protein
MASPSLEQLNALAFMACKIWNNDFDNDIQKSCSYVMDRQYIANMRHNFVALSTPALVNRTILPPPRCVDLFTQLVHDMSQLREKQITMMYSVPPFATIPCRLVVEYLLALAWGSLDGVAPAFVSYDNLMASFKLLWAHNRLCFFLFRLLEHYGIHLWLSPTNRPYSIGIVANMLDRITQCDLLGDWLNMKTFRHSVVTIEVIKRCPLLAVPKVNYRFVATSTQIMLPASRPAWIVQSQLAADLDRVTCISLPKRRRIDLSEDNDDDDDNNTDDDGLAQMRNTTKRVLGDTPTLQCGVCFDYCREVRFDPCGHLLCCVQCARALPRAHASAPTCTCPRKCPVCARPIRRAQLAMVA